MHEKKKTECLLDAEKLWIFCLGGIYLGHLKTFAGKARPNEKGLMKGEWLLSSPLYHLEPGSMAIATERKGSGGITPWIRIPQKWMVKIVEIFH